MPLGAARGGVELAPAQRAFAPDPGLVGVLCRIPDRGGAQLGARALARRIAAERGWRIGEEIGWQIRFERRFSERTRLLVATEGILTARLQSDPLLSDEARVEFPPDHYKGVRFADADVTDE